MSAFFAGQPNYIAEVFELKRAIHVAVSSTRQAR